jgi:hypothetical protein
VDTLDGALFFDFLFSDSKWLSINKSTHIQMRLDRAHHPKKVCFITTSPNIKAIPIIDLQGKVTDKLHPFLWQLLTGSDEQVSYMS